MSAVLSHPSVAKQAPRTGANLSLVNSTVSNEVVTEHATIRTATNTRMIRSKLNVRHKGSGDVSELAAIIRSQGLLQNLVGFQQMRNGVPTGIIEIVAGGRRLEAITLNISLGALPEDYQIPYLLVSEDEAVEISLAENSGREPMHPADVFEAMFELSKRGKSIDDIAIAFGVEPLTVKRRLKLANVSPRLVEMYRNDQIEFDQMVALAISDSHKAQEQAWDGSSKYDRQPWNLRKKLTQQQISIDDKRVKFVGIAAYEKAGGIVLRDLFSDDNTGYITNVALLESLATEKLKQAATKLESSGSKWVDVRVLVDDSDLAEYAKVRTTYRKPNEKEMAAINAVDTKLAALQVTIDDTDEDDEETIDALYEQQSELENKQSALQRGLAEPHPADVALAGSIVTIDRNGKLVSLTGMIRGGDKSKMEKLAASSTQGSGDKPKVKSIHSDRLTRILTAHRTVALKAEMMNRPDVALVVLTHALVKRTFFNHEFHDADSLAQISLTVASMPEEVKTGAAWAAFEEKRTALAALFPEIDDGLSLFAWLMDQPQATIFELMAFCTSNSLDAIQQRESESAMFVEVGKSIELNMCNWWKPTADSYFNHVSKARVIDVMKQAVSVEAAVPFDKMKKAAAAEAAERGLATSTWLPEAMRVA